MVGVAIETRENEGIPLGSDGIAVLRPVLGRIAKLHRIRMTLGKQLRIHPEVARYKVLDLQEGGPARYRHNIRVDSALKEHLINWGPFFSF